MPERIVFIDLKNQNWLKAAQRTGRPFSEFADACERARHLSEHHDWVRFAATSLVLGGDTLWQAMCAEWAQGCLDKDEAERVVQIVQDAVDGVRGSYSTQPQQISRALPRKRTKRTKKAARVS